MNTYRHQILIASYHKDFPWLRHCLRSLAKFSHGFMLPVVAVPAEDYTEAMRLVSDLCVNAEVKVWNGPGFGRAQDAMMSGDILCPGADYFWLLGSDCLAVESFGPEDYCDAAGRPIMLWHTWPHLATHCPEALFWKAGVEKALGGESHGEFMRRLPLAYPTCMMEPFRQHVADLHGERFTPYVWREVNETENFSESNVMGEYAFRYCHHHYTWICIDDPRRSHPVGKIIQMWSHGSFDRPHDSLKRTPREIITEALGSF